MKTTMKTILAVFVLAISFVAFQSFKSSNTNQNLIKETPNQIINYQADNGIRDTGKCGDGKADKKEDKDTKDAKDAKTQGKCGEGKCGDGNTAKDSISEKKAEKCGDGKATKDKNEEKKDEGKCGKGKCGNGK